MLRSFLKSESSKKGGETMKTLCLMFGLLLVIGGSAMAESVTVDTYANWNLVAAPCVPFNSDPVSLFNGYDLEFTAGLFRFDAPTQGQLPYDAYATPPTAFGNILLGDGYTFYNPDADQIIFDGVNDGVPGVDGMTDMWISLPGSADPAVEGGWHCIGHPFNHDTAIDPLGDNTGSGIFFTDGTELKNWSQANAAQWVSDGAQYFDGATQSQPSTGYFFNEDDHFRAGHGYWLYTMKDNLAMIIPAN